MADEFNPNPWRNTDKYVDRTYPSGVARERPMLTTRIHCEPERETVSSTAMQHGPDRERELERLADSPFAPEEESHGESMVERFNRQLRGGHSQNERD